MKIMYANVLDTFDRSIVVHGCNAQGVMKSGFAAEVKLRFPSAYQDYINAYHNNGLKLGDVIFSPPNKGENRKFWIANAITQEFYGNDDEVAEGIVFVNYEAIREAFKKVVIKAKEEYLIVNYPKIGSGRANGKWEIISEIIEEECADINHALWINDGKNIKL